MKNELAMKPTYWANVSGGKDSLFMLKYILSNLDVYPLDGVVHFELEIDYPFIYDVIDYMEKECKKHGIAFLRIRPRKSWYDLYDKYGMPTRQARWCNSAYKLDALRQLKEMQKELGNYVISYIGYCADETKRYNNRNKVNEIYPLVDAGIKEDDILKWAKKQKIFNDFYVFNKRCGCMYCPMASRMELAYLYYYYYNEYQILMRRCRETEKKREIELGKKFSVWSTDSKYNTDYIDNIIVTKWLPKLKEREEDMRVGYMV